MQLMKREEKVLTDVLLDFSSILFSRFYSTKITFLRIVLRMYTDIVQFLQNKTTFLDIPQVLAFLTVVGLHRHLFHEWLFDFTLVYCKLYRLSTYNTYVSINIIILCAKGDFFYWKLNNYESLMYRSIYISKLKQYGFTLYTLRKRKFNPTKKDNFFLVLVRLCIGRYRMGKNV